MEYKPVGQGERGRILEFGGLRLTESLHPPDGRLDPHAHRPGCMTLLLGGTMRESFRSSAVDCGHGGLIIKPPETVHSTRFGSGGAHCLIVEWMRPTVGPLERSEAVLDRVAYRPLDRGLARRIVAELAVRDTASEVLLEGITYQLIGLAMRTMPPRTRHPARPAAWLSGVHDRIQSDFRSSLSIAELAASAGRHPDHLGRAFRRQYGCSIGDLIRDLRLSWAAEQLTGTDRELSAISIEAGFCDQSHFSRAFRRRFGLPPGSYRSMRGR